MALKLTAHLSKEDISDIKKSESDIKNGRLNDWKDVKKEFKIKV